MIPFSSLVRGAAKESRTKLAQAMIDARLEAGYTQKELAELMATSQSTIARIESGKDKLTVATLEKWSEATGKQLEIRLV
ncbi:MAG TPA: helix-turn-helix transcriptional regulator [Acidobacteriaceae bacterium]|nr:helix-turn-helix transcriptional regulator [Acidobacteriaceae bacterium]